MFRLINLLGFIRRRILGAGESDDDNFRFLITFFGFDCGDASAAFDNVAAILDFDASRLDFVFFVDNKLADFIALSIICVQKQIHVTIINLHKFTTYPLHSIIIRLVHIIHRINIAQILDQML